MNWQQGLATNRLICRSDDIYHRKHLIFFGLRVVFLPKFDSPLKNVAYEMV